MRYIYLLLGSLALVACQEATPPSAEGTIKYTNAKWWDDGSFTSDDRCTSGDRIVVCPAEVTEIVDLEGAYAIPGLAESHNHNIDNNFGFTRMNPEYLKRGIFYVKNPNSVASDYQYIEADVAKPQTIDAIFSMGGVTVAGGHPERLYVEFLSQMPAYMGRDFDSLNGDAFHLVASEADIVPTLDLLQEQGAQFVKTYLLYSEEFEKRVDDDSFYGAKGLSPELHKTLTQAAQARGLNVSAHVETAADFAAAVASGVDEINHLPGYAVRDVETIEAAEARYLIPEIVAQSAAEKGIAVVTTTVISTNFYQDNPSQYEMVKAMQVKNISTLKEAGVFLAIGSDNYMSTAAEEAQHLVDIGAMTTEEVLDYWIKSARRVIFPDRAIDCLTVGCEASFISVAGDPRENLPKPDTITYKVKQGYRLN
ncbi:MAG: amidohydrolase family protein [Aquisalinus sp.]|nr:amidohydrolase family protein [Aquisalinus sp.]